MQKTETVDYLVKGNTYTVKITYKTGVKNMYLKPSKDGLTYILTCNYFTKREVIDKFINRVIVKLEARTIKPKNPYIKNKVYLFSKLTEIQYSLFLTEYSNGVIYIKNEKDLEPLLKKLLLDYIKERVIYYSKKMRVHTTYNVVIKKYKGRYGTNFGSKCLLSFALNLVHFSPNVIDSVIVHELTHDKVRNHSPRFYERLLKYYPEYYKYHDALVKLDYECQ